MRFRILCLSILLFGTAAPASADPALWAKLNLPGHFAIMRHATAPGVGDPAAFRVDDCTTQRNLDETGRAEARAVGAQARAAGIAAATVYSSQWCRCMETARLLGFGPVEALPALNSFYQRSGERDDRMRALRAFIEQLSPDAGPLILVTHQVTISALTGQFAASGEVLVLRRRDQGGVELVGSFAPK